MCKSVFAEPREPDVMASWGAFIALTTVMNPLVCKEGRKPHKTACVCSLTHASNGSKRACIINMSSFFTFASPLALPYYTRLALSLCEDTKLYKDGDASRSALIIVTNV